MKNLEWIRIGYFAHRGLHTKKIPENTMAAFKNAVNHGVDIELDIRLTKDNQIVVYHDGNIKRLCGVDIKVRDLDYSELKKYSIRNTEETIPLLTKVLDTLPKETMYLIELKPERNPKFFVSKFLELMKSYDITYAVHSFDPRIINQFKKQNDSIIRGQISSTFPKEKNLIRWYVKHLFSNLHTKPDFTNYRFEDLPRKKLDKLHKKGHMVLSYVARSEKGLNFIRDRYDNAVFENFIPKTKS